jgi:hypothetical protein
VNTTGPSTPPDAEGSADATGTVASDTAVVGCVLAPSSPHELMTVAQMSTRIGSRRRSAVRMIDIAPRNDHVYYEPYSAASGSITQPELP